MKNPTFYNPPLLRRRSTSSRSGEARRLSTLLPGMFFLGTLLLGGIMGLSTLPRTPLLNDSSVVDGKWAATLERGFNEAQPLRNSGLAGWTALEFYAFGDARAGAHVGTQGWMFTSEELAFLPGAAQQTERTLERIVQVKQTLDRQNIALVVALLPSKARVYPDKLEGRRMPDYLQSTYADFRGKLRAAGVSAPDLLAPLERARVQGQTFLRTDTHWTPLGARVTAQALAGALPQDLPRTEFESRKIGETPLRGDLLNFLPLGVFSAGQPAPDTLEQYRSVQTGGGALGLLDAATPPVVLVGTSFSASPRWHFEGALKDTLNADVLNVALEGRGPMLPMNEYLSSAEFRDTPPQVVVWEIPERYIGVAEGAKP